MFGRRFVGPRTDRVYFEIVPEGGKTGLGRVLVRVIHFGEAREAIEAHRLDSKEWPRETGIGIADEEYQSLDRIERGPP